MPDQDWSWWPEGHPRFSIKDGQHIFITCNLEPVVLEDVKLLPEDAGKAFLYDDVGNATIIWWTSFFQRFTSDKRYSIIDCFEKSEAARAWRDGGDNG